jgi:beta-glucoside PTS system EIICBA component
MSYTSSVLPIIFGTYFLSFLYKRLVKKMPTAFRNFVAPAITILVGVFGILLIVGPAFTFLGMGIAKIIEMIRGIPYIGGGLLGMIIGALWQVFVVFGAHWALVPIMFMEMSSNMVDGQTWLLSYVAAATQLAVLAQVAAVVAMALRMKNKERKAAALSTSISGLFGITEPIIYGFTLPKKQPFLYGCIGGAVGGLIVGALKVVPIFGPQGVLVISSTVYKGVGDVQFWGYLIGLLAAVSITFLLTFSLYKPDEAENREIEAVEKVDISGIDTEKASKIYAPAPGLILPLKQSADEVHQEETLGKGIIILPTGGKIYAPFDGTVDMIADTHHAVGLKSKDGVELLIHVGIDTVKLNKEGFTIAVTEGQEVRKGDLLLRYDKDIIARKGFSLETQVIVTNTPNYKQVTIGHLGKTEGRHLVLYAEAFA